LVWVDNTEAISWIFYKNKKSIQDRMDFKVLSFGKDL
jgi:hypothetical protein